MSEIKNLPSVESLSAKNSFDFVDKIKGIVLDPDEIMVSFDVESLFPSIPVTEALKEMEAHLVKLNVSEKRRNVYMQTARLCMNQNYFEFREKFYRVEEGTSMGNPLSPLISEFFMSAFEVRLKRMNWLPRIWLRFVDDVFAIIKACEVENTLKMLNEQFPSINFTVETENNGKISFLDLELSRKNGVIDLVVFHKPTATLRYITSDQQYIDQQYKPFT